MSTGKSYPKELIQKIRKEVLKGKTKYRVAKEMGINELVVYSHTSDLPSVKLGEPCIKGITLDLLNQLLKKGFVNSDTETKYFLRRLKKYLPMIQRSQIQGKAIYYLDDKNVTALHEMISRGSSRIISYQELSQISKIFNVALSSKEKTRLIGKKREKKNRKKQCSMKDSLLENSDSLVDFYIRKYCTVYQQENCFFR